MNEKTDKKGCLCPFCNEEVGSTPSHFCTPCQVELRRCVKCMVVVEQDAKICPKCGEQLG